LIEARSSSSGTFPIRPTRFGIRGARHAGSLLIASRSFSTRRLTKGRRSKATFARRGVVAIPTGAGKTRIALAALFETGLPTAILCPTKALAVAWVEELKQHLDGEPVGLVGDGIGRSSA
jgi:hypothetical protein